MCVIWEMDLLTGGQVESEGDSCGLPLPLELLPHDEVAVIVEDELVREGVKEEVVVDELVAPG